MHRLSAVAFAMLLLAVLAVPAQERITLQERSLGNVLLIAYSADGKLMATAHDYAIAVWDAGSRKRLAVLEGSIYGIQNLVFSPDGRVLTARSTDNYVRSWSVATGQEQSVPTGHSLSALSPDGSLIATAGHDGLLRVFEAGSSKETFTLQRPLTRVNAVALSPDAGTLATAQSDSTVHLWNLEKKTEEVLNVTDVPSLVRFLPDGKTLAVQAGALQLWALETRLKRTDLPRAPGVTLSPDGTRAVVNEGVGGFKLWDLTRGKEIGSLPRLASPLSRLEFTPDGKNLVASLADGEVQVWSADEKAEDFDKARVTLQKAVPEVVKTAASPEGDKAAAAMSDGSIRVWDRKSAREETIIPGFKNVRLLQVAKGGKALFAGNDGHEVRLWALPGGEPRGEALPGVAFAEFTPDGKKLAVGQNDGTIKLLSADSGAVTGTLSGHKAAVHSLDFTPDGKYLLSGIHNVEYHLWDVVGMKERAAFPGVARASFSPDGKTLATFHSDSQTLKLWDMTTPAAEGGGLKEKAAVATPHPFFTFTPDGKAIVLGTVDNTLRILDAGTGKDRPGIPDVRYAVPIAGGRVLGFGAEGPVRVWDLQSQKAVATLEGSNGSLSFVLFSSDFGVVTFTSGPNAGRVWDLSSAAAATPEKPVTILEKTRLPSGARAQFLPGAGSLLCLAEQGGGLRFWDAAAGVEKSVLQKPSPVVSATAQSPAAPLLLLGYRDGAVKLMDIDPASAGFGKETGTLPQPLGEGEKSSGVQALAVSRDGKRTAISHEDGSIDVWDAGARRWFRFRLEGGAAAQLGFSGDGKRLVTRAFDAFSTMKVWDIDGGKELATLPGRADRAWAVESDVLAESGADGGIRVWDLGTGKERDAFQRAAVPLSAMLFAADGKHLITGHSDGAIRFWDARRGASDGEPLVGKGDENKSPIIGLVLSADGKVLAARDTVRRVRLSDVAERRQRATIQFGPNDPMGTILLSPDGATLAMRTDTSGVRLWDTRDGKPIGSVHEPAPGASVIAAADDGKKLAAGGSDGTVLVWSLPEGANGKPIPEPQRLKADTKSPIMGLAVSADGQLIAAGTTDGKVWVWDAKGKPRKMQNDPPPHTRPPMFLLFSPDGKTLFSRAAGDPVGRLWNTDRESMEFGKVKGSVQDLPTTTAPVPFAFSPDGTMLAGVTANGTRIWETDKAEVKYSLPNGPGAVLGLSFSGDSKTLAVRLSGGQVRAFNAETGKTYRYLHRTGGEVRIAFAPDGKSLIAATPDGTIDVWDPRTAKMTKSFRIGTPQPVRLVVSPDGKSAAGLLGNTASARVALWDLEAGKEMVKLDRVPGLGTGGVLSFSPDGKRLAVSGPEKVVTILDLTTGKVQNKIDLPNPGIPAIGFTPDGLSLVVTYGFGIHLHDLRPGEGFGKLRKSMPDDAMDVANPASFSAAGSLMTTWSKNWGINLWNVAAESKDYGRATHLPDAAYGHFSPDGKTLVSGSKDGTVRLWNTDVKSNDFGKDLSSPGKHTSTARVLVFDDDGRTVATRVPDTGETRVWDVKLQAEISSGTLPGAVVATPAGRLFASATSDGAVRLWEVPPVEDDRPTSRPLVERAVLYPAVAQARAMVLAPDGQTAVIGLADGRVLLVDVRTGAEKAVLEGGSLAVYHLAMSADGKTLAAATEVNIRLWRRSEAGWKEVASRHRGDGPSLGLVRRFRGPFTELSISDDGNTLLFTADGEVVAWDVKADDGQVLGSAKRRSLMRALLLSGNPGRVAMVGNFAPAPVYLWDSAGDREPTVLLQPMTTPTHVLFSPDCQTLFTSGSEYNGVVHAWDARKASRRCSLEGSTGSTQAIALSADGRLLGRVGNDGTVRFWNVTGNPEDRGGIPPNGGNSYSAKLAFSPDGQTAVVGRGYALEVWEPVRGEAGDFFVERRAALQQAAYRAQLVLISRDGKVVVTLNGNYQLQAWDTGTGEERLSRANVQAAAMSDDGRTLVWYTGRQRGIMMRDLQVAGGEEKDRTILSGSAFQIYERTGLALSPDGQTLIAATYEQGKYSTIAFDPATGKERFRLAGQMPLGYSGDGKLLAVRDAANSNRIRVYDATGGEEKVSLTTPSFYGRQPVFSPDGRFMTFGVPGENGLRIWDLATGGDPVTAAGYQGNVLTVAFSPDSKTLLSLDTQGLLKQWDPGKGTEKASRRLTGRGFYSPVVSPDGRTIAIGGDGGQVRLVDAATGAERAVLRARGPGAAATQLAYSGDGATLVSSQDDGALRVWYATPAKEDPPLAAHKGPVTAVALSGDGKTLLTGSSDRTVRAWGLPANSRPPRVLIGHTGTVLSVAVAPDGKTFASGGADRMVRLWRLPGGEEVKQLRGHKGGVRHFAITPDGKYLLSAGGWPQGDGTVRLWDIDAGKEVRQFEGHAKNSILNCVAISPDGKQAVTGGADLNIILWDLETGKELRRMRNPGEVHDASFTADGKRLVTASNDRMLRLWDLETGKEVQKFEGHTDVTLVARFSPNEKRLASASFDKTMRLWDVETGKEVLKIDGFEGFMEWIRWLDDDRLITVGGDAMVRLWDAKTGKELRRFAGHGRWLRAGAISPDQRRVLSADDIGGVRIWDFETGKELRRFELGNVIIEHAEYLPDGGRAITSGSDGVIRIWDMAAGEQRSLGEHGGEVWSLAFSPDGKRLATGCADKTVRVYDVSGGITDAGYGKLLHKLEGHEGDVFAVAFSPDGQTLATGDGDLFTANKPGTVRLWDLATGKELRVLKGHTGAVRALAFRADGKTLASGGSDRSVLLWDVGGMKTSPTATLVGHGQAVVGVAFAPDGKTLASASANPLAPAEAGEVYLWDLATGKVKPPLMGARHGLTGVTFSPDGKKVLAGCYDETVRVWLVEGQ